MRPIIGIITNMQDVFAYLIAYLIGLGAAVMMPVVFTR